MSAHNILYTKDTEYFERDKMQTELNFNKHTN